MKSINPVLCLLQRHPVRRLVWAALSAWLSLTVWPVASISHAQTDVSLYIPALARHWASIGIHGELLLNGSPAAGEVVFLGNPANIPSYSAVLTTTTGADGTYSFFAAPVLLPGNSYHVIYVAPNPGGSTRIDYVQSSAIAYTTQSFTSVPAIEIAPITLIDPAPDATIPYTYTFHWTTPAALSSLQTTAWLRVFYRNVFGLISDPMAASPVTGLSEYEMHLNSGSCGFCFIAGSTYRWHIEVSGPNGEYRETADRLVRFSNP